MPKGVYPRKPENVAKHAEALRGRKQTPESNAKRSATLRNRYAIQKHHLLGRHYSDEHRANISAALTGVKRSKETCESISAGHIAYMVRSWHDRSYLTKGERIVASALIAAGLLPWADDGFIPQHPMGRYVLDFLIPSSKLNIEFDGTYWHNRPGMKEKDDNRDRWLERKGLRVLRINDKQDNVVEQVLSALR
jgi:very-short-patch-repair endonuclease